MMSQSTEILRREQRAFERQLPELLKEHRGEYAVYQNGKAVGFYRSHFVAYRAALDCCGHDAVFLVSEITETMTESVPVTWELGLLSGRDRR